MAFGKAFGREGTARGEEDGMRGRIKRTVLFLFAVLLSAVFWPVVVRGETDKKDIETDIEKTDEGEPLILAEIGRAHV